MAKHPIDWVSGWNVEEDDGRGGWTHLAGPCDIQAAANLVHHMAWQRIGDAEGVKKLRMRHETTDFPIPAATVANIQLRV